MKLTTFITILVLAISINFGVSYMIAEIFKWIFPAITTGTVKLAIAIMIIMNFFSLGKRR